jgi:hypothetical protein
VCRVNKNYRKLGRIFVWQAQAGQLECRFFLVAAKTRQPQLCRRHFAQTISSTPERRSLTADDADDADGAEGADGLPDGDKEAEVKFFSRLKSGNSFPSALSALSAVPIPGFGFMTRATQCNGRHPACRRAGLLSPAEETSRQPMRVEIFVSRKSLVLFSGRQDAALYVRQDARRYIPDHLPKNISEETHPRPLPGGEQDPKTLSK